MPVKVFLNPGHSTQWEIDHADGEPGACANGLRECDIAKQVTDKLEAALKKWGLEVVGNLQSDDLYKVVDTANASGADLFVSVHCNAASPAAEGTETLYCAGYNDDKEFAQCINDRIVEDLDLTDRGVKPDTAAAVGSLYVLRQTDMTAALVELAFITNPEEAEMLKNNQEKFALAIAKGILDYEEMEIPGASDSDTAKEAAWKEDLGKIQQEITRYNTVDELPKWAKPTIEKMIAKGILKGGGKKDESGKPTDLDFSKDMLRMAVYNDRAGLYD